MGKSQRDKGNRVERGFVKHWRGLGYPAQRVPLSGATDYAKGDVEVQHVLGEKTLYEIKARASNFDSLYSLLDAFYNGQETLYVSVPNKENPQELDLVSLSYKAFPVPPASRVFPLYIEHTMFATHGRALKRISNLRPMIESADILVLKGDRKPYIYVRFY